MQRRVQVLVRVEVRLAPERVVMVVRTAGLGLGEGAELASSQLGRGYYVTGGAWRPSGGMWRLIFKA